MKRIIISYMEYSEKLGGVVYKKGEIHVNERDVLSAISDLVTRGHTITFNGHTTFIFPSAILSATVDQTWSHL